MLAPIVFPVTVRLVGEEEISFLSGVSGVIRLLLIFVALMGALGILVVIWIMRKNKLGKPLLRTSCPAILLAGFVDITIGLFFLPATVLLAVAALGLFREEPGSKA